MRFIKIKKIFSALFIFSILFNFIHCGNGGDAAKKAAEEKFIMVNAAAGMKIGLDDLNAEFEKRTGVKVIAQYMCSAMVLANLLLTKETDVFFPGSEYFMNIAIEKGAIKKEDAFPGAYMVPAITTPKGNPQNVKTIEDMCKPGVKVGLGDPKALAVGRLSKRLLEEQGLWHKIQKNWVFNAPSVTKLQINVVLKGVDAAISFRPDILLHGDTCEIIDIPNKKLKFSIAPCGLSTFTKKRDWALQYVNFIKSEEGQKIFKKWGYVLPAGVNMKNIERVE